MPKDLLAPRDLFAPKDLLAKKPTAEVLPKPLQFLAPTPGVSATDIAKQFGIGAVSEAALGFPLFALEKGVSPEAREALISPARPERIARGVGTTAGFLLGAPAKVFAKGARLGVKGVQALRRGKELGRFARAAGAGAGALGLFEAVKAPEEEFAEKIRTVPIATIAGATLGVAGEVIAPPIRRLLNKIIGKSKTVIEKTIVQETKKDVTKLLEFKPTKKTPGLGVFTEQNTQEALAGINQRIKNNLSVLTPLRQRRQAGLPIEIGEIRALERNLKQLLDTQGKLLRASTSSRLLPSSLEIASKKTREEFGFVTKKTFEEINQQKLIKAATAKVMPESQIPKQTLSEVGNIKKNTIFRNALVSSEREYLRSQGNSGQRIVIALDNVRNQGEIRAGTAVADYLKLRKGMSAREMSNFVDVVEGRATALNDKVGGLANFWRNRGREIVNEGVSLGMNTKRVRLPKGVVSEIELLKPRQNYFPHLIISLDSSPQVVEETLQAAVKRGNFVSMEKARRAWQGYKNFSTTGKKGEAILQYFVDTRQTQTKAEAERLLSTFIRRGRQRRFGNLERAREFNLPFYDVNPDRVLPKYFNGAFHRLEEVKNLGLRDEIMRDLINQMRDAGGDYRNAQGMFERWAGKEPERLLFGGLPPNFAQGTRGVQVVTKLGLAQIPNSTQSINTAFVTGMRNTAIGIQKAVTREGKDFALRTGAVLDATVEDAIQRAIGGVGGFPRKFLKLTGFSATERMNRIIAANAGRAYANEMTNRLLRNPIDKLSRRAIKELGLNADKIIQRGSITFDEVLLAAQRVVNKSQFRSGILDLPLFFTSPEGKIITQFKTFSFNQAKLLKDALLLEALRGNLRPMITAVALMPILGEGVRDLKSLLTGRSRDKTGLSRLAENISAVGGLGIISDLYQSAGVGRATDFLVGPTGSDIGNLLNVSVQATKGKPTQAGRFATRQIPVAGQFISRTLFPPKNVSQANVRKLRQLRKLK